MEKKVQYDNAGSVKLRQGRLWTYVVISLFSELSAWLRLQSGVS